MILILGANGQLGKEFKKLFKQLEIKSDFWTRKDLDLTRIDHIKEKFNGKKYNLIINCMGYTDIEKAEKDWELCYRINSYSAREIAKIARSMRATLISFSSNFIFDGKKHEPYYEEEEPNPLGEYGASKALGERLILETWSEALIVRTGWIYGGNRNNFIENIIKSSQKNEAIKIADDEIGTPILAEDLAYYTWELYKKGVHGIYNITNNGEVSRYNLARYIFEINNCSGRIIPCKRKDLKITYEIPQYSVLSLEKTEKILGERIHSWEISLESYLKNKKN